MKDNYHKGAEEKGMEEKKYGSEEFLEWVKTQETEGCEKEVSDERSITFKTSRYTGFVRIYPDDIAELGIRNNSTEETEFYLHFNAGDKEHAEDLFHNMIETLLKLENRKTVKVLLSCTSALTTSYFAEELNNAAKMLKMDYEFNAADHNKIYNIGFDYDAILLAPQIHYEYKKISSIFKDKIVWKIPASDFAQYSTASILKYLEEQKDRRAMVQEEAAVVPAVVENSDRRILVIGMINHMHHKRLAYRIYDHGKKTLDKEVIKDALTMRDLEDLLDYVFVRHENIDCVVLGLPGVEENGKLNYPAENFCHEDIKGYFEKKYDHRFYLLNDANAIALGCSCADESLRDLLFYFQPRGSYVPGTGLILDGELRKGRKNAAGELRPLMERCIENLREKILVPDGAMEIVALGLTSFICTVSPQKIVLYSELTPDASEVKKELAKNIPEEYIPEIEVVTHLKMWMLTGLLAYGLQKEEEAA